MREEFYQWLDQHYTTWGQAGFSRGSTSGNWRLQDLYGAWLAGRAYERAVGEDGK